MNSDKYPAASRFLTETRANIDEAISFFNRLEENKRKLNGQALNRKI